MKLQRKALKTLKQWKTTPDHKPLLIRGARQTGKTWLVNEFANGQYDNIVSVDFMQRPSLSGIFEQDLDPQRIIRQLELAANQRILPGRTLLFFDEIQMVENFQKVIDSLFLLDNVDIYVTGSNAYLLSGEIATLLTGRYIEIKLFPFSFREFIQTQPAHTSRELAYRQYIELGSFPYIPQISQDREMVREYLSGLYNTIVLKDVVSRKKITDVMMLQSVVRFLADNIGNISVIKRISDTMTSLGRKTTSHTIENYVSALTDSYIFYPVQRYDAKGKQLLKTGQKLYLADVGLRQVINGTKGGDLGHVLENIVYLELARRGGEIYVGKAGDAEIDFVVIIGEHKAYYQVSLSVRDETTMQRELAPLKSISDNFPKYLLTLDNDPVQFHDGIKQEYVLDWLMECYDSIKK